MESFTFTDVNNYFTATQNGRTYHLPYGSMAVKMFDGVIHVYPMSRCSDIERFVINYGVDTLNVGGTTSFANIAAATTAIATVVFKHA